MVNVKKQKDNLVNWCAAQVRDYDVEVKNLTTSWKSGLALCAILHYYDPDTIEYDSLNVDEAEKNIELALKVAKERWGIYPLIDAEDLLIERPDSKQMYTYLAEYYKRFQTEFPKGGKASITVQASQETAANESQVSEGTTASKSSKPSIPTPEKKLIKKPRRRNYVLAAKRVEVKLGAKKVNRVKVVQRQRRRAIDQTPEMQATSPPKEVGKHAKFSPKLVQSPIPIQMLNRKRKRENGLSPTEMQSPRPQHSILKRTGVQGELHGGATLEKQDLKGMESSESPPVRRGRALAMSPHNDDSVKKYKPKLDSPKTGEETSNETCSSDEPSIISEDHITPGQFTEEEIRLAAMSTGESLEHPGCCQNNCTIL